MPDFTIPELIKKKRDGLTLSNEEMDYFVQSAHSGKADPSQIGAMLMAMFKSNLGKEETSALTSSMVHSGSILSWQGTVVDKHSTGGVGDKVSLMLVPALAALGLTVPMISGRGLGWTGGTLDKLESIPGYRVELSKDEMTLCLKQTSCFIAATTGDICPADKILYKIRDVTSTVDNYSLITGSILSKKIAAGVKHLILDIKVGKGAFMKSIQNAEELAEKMISTSKAFDMQTRVVLTRMDCPIGMTIGNSLEIEESIDTLLGKGPEDLLQLINRLGGELLQMCGKAESVERGVDLIQKVITNGSALKIFINMLRAQGVDDSTATALGKGNYSSLPKCKETSHITSEHEGYIENIDGLSLGKVCWLLGAGRSNPEDNIDHSVGIRLVKKQGDYVNIGDTLMTVYHNSPLSQKFTEQLVSSYLFSNQKPKAYNIIIKTIC